MQIVDSDIRDIERSTGVARAFYRSRTESTSDWAIESARDPRLATPALFFTRDQTAGRGQGHRTWQSSAGSLTFSLVVPRPVALSAPSSGLLPLVMAGAVCDYLAELPVPAMIKWPNDIMLDDRKLGGILIESAGVERLVIGCGVNVRNRAPLRQSVSLVEMLAEPPQVVEALIGVTTAMLGTLRQFPPEPAVLPDSIRRRDWLDGKRVHWESSGKLLSGTAAGLAADGGLNLRIAAENGVRVVHSGRVTVVE